MSSQDHILILGAGLIGLSTADALLRAGAVVTIVDAREPMSGASFANSGMIHPSQACSWSGEANAAVVDAAVCALAMRSRDLLDERMAALGLEAMRARGPGCYQIFETQALAEAARARLHAREIAVEGVPGDALPLGRPALYFPEDRSGDACAYGRALLADCLARGAVLRSGEASVSMERDKPVISVPGERIEADHVVLACGWETDALLAPLGLSLGIEPVRGWALDFAKADGVDLPDAPIMDARTRSALTVFEDRIRLSGTWGEASPDLLAARWKTLWPELFEGVGEPTLVWSGLRPVSPLGRPLIGPTALPGLWVNAGHGHMGWTLCAGSGELTAEMILEGRAAPDFALPEVSNVTCMESMAV